MAYMCIAASQLESENNQQKLRESQCIVSFCVVGHGAGQQKLYVYDPKELIWLCEIGIC